MNKRVMKVIGIIIGICILGILCSFEVKSKTNIKTISINPTAHDSLCGISGNFETDVLDGKVYCDEYGTIINSQGFPIETYKDLSCNSKNEIIVRETKISLKMYYVDECRQVHIFEGGDLEW